MTPTEQTFWRKVYVAAIRRGYAPDAAATLADKSVDLHRERMP